MVSRESLRLYRLERISGVEPLARHVLLHRFYRREFAAQAKASNRPSNRLANRSPHTRPANQIKPSQKTAPTCRWATRIEGLRCLKQVGAGRVQAGWRLRDFLSITIKSCTAAGVTPGMRLACPSVAGRTCSSLAVISRDRPDTSR